MSAARRNNEEVGDDVADLESDKQEEVSDEQEEVPEVSEKPVQES